LSVQFLSIFLKSQGAIGFGSAHNPLFAFLEFLSKEKNKKALELLKKGYKGVEVSKIVGININTITKVKKLGLVF
jgi:hypothetical protein